MSRNDGEGAGAEDCPPVAGPDDARREEILNLAMQIAGKMTEERDLVHELLGQAKMAGALEKFSRIAFLFKLKIVKENKLYKGLRGKKSPHGAEFSGTWEGFCALIGKSVDQVDRDIANSEAFGQEALEALTRIGFGYREFRQLRKLPEDQKTALIEAARSGDKDGVLELAEELIAKHALEKEALSAGIAERDARVEELRLDREAQGRLLADANQKYEKLWIEMDRKKRNPDPPDVEAGELRQALAHSGHLAKATIMTALRRDVRLLWEHGQQHAVSHTEFMTGVLKDLANELRLVFHEFGLGDYARDLAFEEFLQMTDAEQTDAIHKASELGEYAQNNAPSDEPGPA